MKNLRLMCVYTNFDMDLYIIPFTQDFDGDFKCKVFKYDKVQNTVTGKGHLWYEPSGVCIGVPHSYNITVQVATNILHPKIKKAIVEWKKEFKKGNKDA